MKKLALLSMTMLCVATLSIGCTKENTVKTSTPKSNIPAPFAGNWSSNSIGLITYWQQGSYYGSYGNTVKTTRLGSDGSADDYGYYEGAYSTTYFYHYNCTAEYKQEDDGSVTINVYPNGGEQIVGSTKKAIASNALYPTRYFVMRNCTVVTTNGKTYLRYYRSDQTGTVSTTQSQLERLQ